jgi:hypothetical protein
MAIRWERKQSVVDLPELLPDILERRCCGLRLASGSDVIDSLLVDCRELLRLKNSISGCRPQGPDRSGNAFFPWCLARAAELAESRSISTIMVLCDVHTWKSLEATRHLLKQLHAGVRIKSRIVPVHDPTMNLASSPAAS